MNNNIQVIPIGSPLGFIVEKILNDNNVTLEEDGKVKEVETVDKCIVQIKLLSSNDYLVMINRCDSVNLT